MVEVAYAGGVFASAIVLAEFRQRVESHGHARVIQPRHDAARGALFEAVRLGHSE
jgi:hypothetical protein